MLDITITEQLEQDFERYMLKFFAAHKRFSLQDFGEFATTILNYNVQNNLIAIQDKTTYAGFLISLYNKGIGNRITAAHQAEIAQVIAADHNINFNVITELFG